VYGRALAVLPGSYKLWVRYLKERIAYAELLHPDDAGRCKVAVVFEQALVRLHKMPVIWEMYARWILDQRRWSLVRPLLNRALQSLAVTQHHRVWKIFLEFGEVCECPQTTVRVLRRYSRIDRTGGAELLFDSLVQSQQYDDAVEVMTKALLNPEFTGKSRNRDQLWREVIKVGVSHPREVFCVSIEDLLRRGIRSAKAEVGELWIMLGQYFMHRGAFERCRDVYEEAMSEVQTVRDFALIYDAYAKLEEEMVTLKLSRRGTGPSLERENAEIEMLLARLERLTERRPLLLSSVVLRQNPHNVREWLKRVDLFLSRHDLEKAVTTFTESLDAVDPWKSTNGRPHDLWIAFARLYEDNGDIESARRILDTAWSQPEKFRGPQDLASLYGDYIETEIKRGEIERARAILTRVTQEPPVKKRRVIATSGHAVAALGAGAGHVEVHYDYTKDPPAAKAWRSPLLWALLLDFVESFGSIDEIRGVYNRMIQLKIATPLMILDATEFLWQRKYFEAAFQLFERSLKLFDWPSVFAIWLRYLERFCSRFEGEKLERTRDLFEQVINEAPRDFKWVGVFYLIYARVEENYGLTSNCLNIYQRAVEACPFRSERPGYYRLCIAKAAELRGITFTRPLFELALEDAQLDRDTILEFAKRYATVEEHLGEIDRARAIFGHAAVWADPRGPPDSTGNKYWRAWKEFEILHGSEDTAREMQRVRRSVTARFANVYLTVARPRAEVEDITPSGRVTLEILERQVEKGGTSETGNPEKRELEPSQTRAAEEVQLDVDDSDGEVESFTDEAKDVEPSGGTVSSPTASRKRALEVVEKEVPEAVFGGLNRSDIDSDAAPPVQEGALARLRRKRAKDGT